jgi:6-phosphogluconolactonase
MSRWQVYAGTFTRHFAQEVERLRASSNVWWAGKGAERTPAGAAGKRAPFSDGIRYPAGGELAEGLEVFEFDDITGKLSYRDAFTSDIVNPQYLAGHPRLPVLYASEFSRPGRLSVFAIGPDGSLDRRLTVGTGADLAIAVSVHPSGNVAYVAHYSDGTLTGLHLADDGSISGIEPVVRGHAPAGAQRFSRHHESHFTASGNGLLVTDIGLEELTVYRAGADGSLSGDDPLHIGFPAGSAPRHMACHPSGRYVYVVGEADSNLYVLEAEDGLPVRVTRSYPTKPADFGGDNKTSDIVLHPNGRVLYVGNRGSDCVTICAVDDVGRVEILGYEKTLGQGPSSLAVAPGGRHLLVGNTYSGNLAVFGIDESGRLHPDAVPVTARAPRCLLFARPLAANPPAAPVTAAP